MEFNNKQKRTLQICFILILLLSFFPPFEIIASAGKHYNKGYSFIFNPPHHNASINYLGLMAEWLGILILSGIAFFYFTGSDIASKKLKEEKPVTENIESKPKTKSILMNILATIVLFFTSIILVMAIYQVVENKIAVNDFIWELIVVIPFFISSLWILFKKK